MTKDKLYKESKIVSRHIRKLTQKEKEDLINPICWGFDPQRSETVYITGETSIGYYCKNDDIQLVFRKQDLNKKHI